MINYEYPYTDFHSMNLDYILRVVRESAGLRLEVEDNKLLLKNAEGTTVSQVTISYATSAEKDSTGNKITAYLISVGTENNTLVFTHGDNTKDIITVPFATKASQDNQGNNITDYIKTVQVSGDKIIVTTGNGNTTTLTIEEANHAVNADNATNANHAVNADNATKASQDSQGNNIVSTYAFSMEANNNDIVLKAKDGTQLARLTVPYAGLADNANNAIQRVEVSGQQLLFTTYAGQQFALSVPYTIKAEQDELGNEIISNYVARASVNASGDIVLSGEDGTIIATLSLSDAIVEDNLGNVIANYINQINANANSNYVTVRHGDGTVDTIQIQYSVKALGDAYGNNIYQNYVHSMAIEYDEDNLPWLVYYNLDNPIAEIGRVAVEAQRAYTDRSGNVFENTYGSSIMLNGRQLSLVRPAGTMSTVELPYNLKSTFTYSIQPSSWNTANHTVTITMTVTKTLSDVIMVSCENGVNAQDAAARASIRKVIADANIMIVEDSNTDSNLILYAETIPTNLINIKVDIFDAGRVMATPIYVNALPCAGSASAVDLSGYATRLTYTAASQELALRHVVQGESSRTLSTVNLSVPTIDIQEYTANIDPGTIDYSSGIGIITISTPTILKNSIVHLLPQVANSQAAVDDNAALAAAGLQYAGWAVETPTNMSDLLVAVTGTLPQSTIAARLLVLSVS